MNVAALIGIFAHDTCMVLLIGDGKVINFPKSANPCWGYDGLINSMATLS